MRDPIETYNMLVPMVVEQTARGERALRRVNLFHILWARTTSEPAQAAVSQRRAGEAGADNNPVHRSSTLEVLQWGLYLQSLTTNVAKDHGSCRKVAPSPELLHVFKITNV